MAENDNHYNNTLYQNDWMNNQKGPNEDAGLTTPLPDFGEGPAIPDDLGQNNGGSDSDRPNRPNRPDNNRPNRPDNNRPEQPDDDQTNQPDNNRPNRPGNNQPNRPDNNRPNRPDNNRPNRPDNNRPNRPDNNRPNRPEWPDWSDNNWSGGIWYPQPPLMPTEPDYTTQSFGQVRFLNASGNTFPVNITIDGTAYAINSRFGTISNYDWVADGFHTVTVRHATGLRSILLQQNFPFVAGQKVTMVLTDAAAGGLEMIRVIDTGCRNLPNNSGCYRFANMSYSGSSYDLQLYGGETIFRNVGYQTVTSYKQAVAGSYQMYVTASNTYTFLTEIPIIMIGIIGGGSNVSQPLLSFTADISAGKHYTTYLIGNTWSDLGLRTITVED